MKIVPDGVSSKRVQFYRVMYEYVTSGNDGTTIWQEEAMESCFEPKE